MSGARVFVVDADDRAREGMRQVLRRSGFSTSGFRSTKAFLDRGVGTGAACVVLEYELLGISGLHLQEQLGGRTLSIVFVAGHGDVPTVVEAMKGGAVDFLPKPVDAEQLVAAVTRGLEQSARAESDRMLHDIFARRLDRLTRRERQVATRLIRGLSNKEIASELGAAEKTVKVHRGRAMSKLEVDSVAELVRLTEKAAIDVC
jgi:FixJ family two-component response regulator